MHGEGNTAFRRRQPKEHFSAQLYISMYILVHESKAWSGKRRARKIPLNVLRLALCALRYSI